MPEASSHRLLAFARKLLPAATCREVIDRLRAQRPALPIVLASGYAAGENIAELTRDREIEFLRKPYDPDGLLRTIRRILDGAPA